MAASSSPYDHQSTVDMTSPFRSVKEAIATYGEQFLARKFAPSDQQKADFVREDFVMLSPVGDGQRVDPPYDHDGGDSGCDGGDGGDEDDDVEGYGHDDDDDDDGKDLNGFAGKLKKLEDELKETKKKLEGELMETKFELKLLKEKESETEVAVATLNAELHKNLSKIARMEATEAANTKKYTSKLSILDKEIGRESRFHEEGKVTEARSTLEQVLDFGVCEGYFLNPKKVTKRKPVVPLITGIFSWKKSPRAKDKDDLAFLSPLYSSSMYLR